MSSVINSLSDIMIGNDAGWLMHFYETVNDTKVTIIEIGRDSYDADIQASLPSGLEGGVYKVDIIGLTDSDYGKISIANNQEDHRNIYVDLYMYWRDTSSVTGYLKSLSNLTDTLGEVSHNDLEGHLVAELAVTRVSRKLTRNKYNTQIDAQEKVYYLAENKPVCGEQTPQLTLDLASTLATSAGIKNQPYPLEACSSQNVNQTLAADASQSVLENLRNINHALEQLTCKRGRGMFLIRDGMLHIGPRPIPLLAAEINLTESVGLIEVETLSKVKKDPNFDPCASEQERSATRNQYKLISKGRADIKPGSIVKFSPPDIDMGNVTGSWTGVYGDLASATVNGGLLPSLSSSLENATSMYVSSVEHRLGRNTGFVTTVTGVTVQGENDFWDIHSDRSRQNRNSDTSQPATPEAQVARTTQRIIQHSINQYSFTEIGEVRAVNVQDQDDVPGQTETVWRGLVNEDGMANQSRRLDIRRPSERAAPNTPYLSPFAWGKCGLMLPRYPGMRVVTTHRQGLQSDPLDIGSLWKSGETSVTQPGDWWLSLPAAVETNKRQSVNNDEVVPAYEDKVTNDLIDADGNRVIEVGSFTLRFVKDKLANAGTRPTAGEEDCVTIENADTSSFIKMKKDGSIEIKGKGITLDGDGNDIILKGNKVKVE
ncbi:MAG: hypothetical protein OQK95_05170 [Gammaproteobacteria bacterium]|nr:hypothetical protein [Gammaproteobacteria bacterium]